MGAALNNLGLAYQDLGETEPAIEHFREALHTLEEAGDKDGIARVSGNLGDAYHDLTELDRAIEYHERALRLSRQDGNQLHVGTLLSRTNQIR